MSKKHASRCDKDYYRSVCPSKLSKRELEDLYYSLLENNLELKRTVNAQTEQNRILSTKVQRMTAQSKIYTGKECCAAAKAVIVEQKAGIADLTKANEALAERIRKLSTQLCTAKQFLKQNPSARGCYKCFASANNSLKILSSASLQNKSSAANLKSAAPSATQIEQEPPSMRTAETNTVENLASDEKKDVGTECTGNKCKSIIEQFKLKIEDLEQVSALQSAAVRVRSAQNMRSNSEELARGLRMADAQKAELEMQLSIEKRKVAELKMRLKAAQLSQHVVKTVESHLSSAYQLEEKQLRETSGERCSACSNMILGDTSPRPIPTTSSKTPNELTLTVPDDKLSKSDDSGYAEHRRETDADEKNNPTNQELLKKIEEMQTQLDAIKTMKAEKDVAKQELLPNYSIFETETTKQKELLTEPEITNKEMCDSEETKNIMPQNALIDSNTPTKDYENPYKDIQNKNDSESDNNSPRNATFQESNSHQQAFDLNSSIECEFPDDNKADLETNTLNLNNEGDEPSKKCISLNKEELIQNAPIENQQGDNNLYLNSLQKDVEIVKPKPVKYYNYEKPNTNKSPDDIKQGSSTIKHSSIVRTQKTVDNNIQKTPEHLPKTNDLVTKRRISLTKRKIKAGGSKRNIVEARDHTKDAKSKIVARKDKKVLMGKHDKDVSDIREVQPRERIRYKGKEEPKSGDFKIDKLPVDDTNNTNYSNYIRGINEYAICQQHVSFCTCPEMPGPHPTLFRSGSGSQILASFPSGKFRRCGCTNGSIFRAPIGSSTPKADRAPTSPHTYTVESDKSDKSRANSPANTEHEISVMTDLPSEKDDLCDTLSPGQQRITVSSTEPYTPNGYTLSEGEVPVNLEHRTCKSLGEVRRNDYANHDSSIGEQRTPAEKMEATLHVISQELARCRSLLQARPREQKQNAATEVDPISLVLRKTEGKSHFKKNAAPSCLLTVHVVSVVLSDQAIMRSRNANLVLTWRFEHKTTMTPLDKGRVTHIDFSTQYELLMTKEVEEYLRNDMQIMLCEMDSAKKPFATCALPLRHTLLNINRRVDMSLPLRAGAYSREKASCISQATDDMGVLDVWCMLLCK